MVSTRIEVRDKQDIYDAIAEGVKSDVKDLGITSVDDVRFVKVYTLRGDLSKKDIKRIARDLLADPVSQEYDHDKGFYGEDRPGVRVVEVAYNPGVMDPVEESVKKAISDMGIAGVRDISTSRKYVLRGDVSDGDLEMVTERLLYNKIIEHVVSDEREERPQLKPYRFKRVEIDILGADDDELMRLSTEGQLYLNLKEMRTIKRYFSGLKRNPTDCELETLAQTWSEHCKHKTMMGAIEYEGRKIDNLLKETVMKVTRELDKSWCVSVFKDNAGIIRFDGENDICFKVETHNHPSALEPYGGAETGIGGVIRDPMGTGRGAKPIINTDIFCFGMPDMSQADVPRGALHPKRVMKGVVSGVRDYGNKMGIPTVNGAVCFDDRYTGNPLVFCGNVGIMPRKFSSKKISPGELIVAVGGRTGRDGIHGATFSSAELTHESESISSTAVQIGNPITEKKVLDTLIKARDMGLYTALTDCGAGGFSSAVGEMGEDTGAEVHLEKAPLKYKGLKPWEIWVSEAQERMVLSVKPSDLRKLMKVFREENVEATVIGRFTETGKLRIFYKGHEVADLDMSFLHDGLPKSVRKAVWKKTREDRNVLPRRKKDYTSDLLNILSSWNVCSKEWIIRQYDHEVQGGSVLKPLVGPENDGPSDASVNRPLLDSDRGVILSNGINPSYGDIDPYWMAASAIDEALRQIVCTGGDIDRTALLDNFCWGNTERPEQLGGLVRAARACYDMARVFGTPFISGKDSLNNEFNTGDGTVSIPPTLLISAVSVIDDAGKTISSDIKEKGDLIYIVGRTYQELGGSVYLKVNGKTGGVVPRVRPERSLKTMRRLSLAVSRGLVRSAHDCSEGGLATALAEMLFSGSRGAEISLADVPVTTSIERDDVILFSESNSRFIVEVPADKEDEFKRTMKGVPAGKLGEVNASSSMKVRGLDGSCVIKAGLKRMKNSWKKPFRKLMHEKG
jgi:phosphoribosylformylglycinamidine synthase